MAEHCILQKYTEPFSRPIPKLGMANDATLFHKVSLFNANFLRS